MLVENDSKVGESRPKTGGRKKGTPNKTTTALKDAILMAAEGVGEDGEGKGGLTGYLRGVAMKDTKAFCGLLGKVLPQTISGDPDSPLMTQEIGQGAAKLAALVQAIAERKNA